MANKSPYKDSLFLPKTDFSMRANLTQREPEMLKVWQDLNIYPLMLDHRSDAPSFVLHDGPPYANGNIHHGHCLNKILKDICVKFKHLEGYKVDYTPGWDCHGLPIEHEVEKHEKVSLLNAERSVIRKHCRAYANKYFKLQKNQFIRLGIFGDFENPYLTMSSEYEAKDLDILAEFVKRGMVYRKKKPVHWSYACQTSLAGSEVEYKEITDHAIYVINQVSSDNTHLKDKLDNTAIVFWTTTPWSIPAVLAISVHRDYTYGAYESPLGRIIIAVDRKDEVEKECGMTLGSPLWTIKGDALEGATYINPVTDKSMPVILGDHVTLEAGTGAVSTAPGHGEDDYQAGIEYGLDIYCPIGPDGSFTDQVPQYKGINAFKANPKIIADLKSKDALLGDTPVTHSYPHCWRSKTPAILRATEQWFIDYSNELRHYSLEGIKSVQWTPEWGMQRMEKMLNNRPDWCISRQRAWGVPIPSLVCKECHEETLSEGVCREVADKFREHSADVWDERPVKELISDENRKCCACGGSKVEKGHNILDVWFDSGISYAAVLKDRLNVKQSDLYLEGNDQFRGWYQSSLLASYGYQDVPPYKGVLTHGMILDEKGHKFSKSSKNYEPSEKFIATRGADVMRLWVASEDFQEDLTFSMENIQRVEDVYRKIRNTFRFMMGVLTEEQDYSRPPKVTHPLHQYMLTDVQRWLDGMRKNYDAYSFNKVFRAFSQFFTTQLSNFYLDILKDTLYCDTKESLFRQEAVSVIGYTAFWASQYLAPICTFMSEDVYAHFPQFNKAHAVFLSPVGWPEKHLVQEDKTLKETFDHIHLLRDKVLLACEPLRNEKVIRTNGQADVTITGSIDNGVSALEQDLPLYFNVSDVKLKVDSTEPTVSVNPTSHNKCGRCWRYLPEIGLEPDYPDLCRRCTDVISEK